MKQFLSVSNGVLMKNREDTVKKALLIGCVSGVLLLGALLLRANREGQRGHERYKRATRVALERFSLHEKDIPVSDRIIIPRRTLGMVRLAARAEEGNRLRHVCILDIRLAGIIRVFTLCLVPDYRYNLPIFSADAVFMGSRRILLLEIIDSTRIEGEHLTAGYQQFREHRSRAADSLSLDKVETTEWARDLLQDFSIEVRAHRRQDALLLKLYWDYLTTWLDMAHNAQPVTPEVQQRVREGIESYVNMLLEQGGPAVDVLTRLFGPERQRRYVQTVIFGIAT